MHLKDASSMTRTTYSYRQKQLNEVHQKQLLNRNEIIIDLTHRFDHIFSALRNRISFLFEFSALADQIEDLKRTHIESIR